MISIRTRYIKFWTLSSLNWSIQNPVGHSVSWMLTPSKDGINLKMSQSKSKWSNWLPMVDLISQLVLVKQAVLKPMEFLLKALRLEASSSEKNLELSQELHGKWLQMRAVSRPTKRLKQRDWELPPLGLWLSCLSIRGIPPGLIQVLTLGYSQIWVLKVFW